MTDRKRETPAFQIVCPICKREVEKNNWGYHYWGCVRNREKRERKDMKGVRIRKDKKEPRYDPLRPGGT
jgi:hypothetical protein